MIFFLYYKIFVRKKSLNLIDNEQFCVISEFVKEELFYNLLKNVKYFLCLIYNQNGIHFKINDFTVQYRILNQYSQVYT